MLSSQPSKPNGQFVELGAWFKQPMLCWCLGQHTALVGVDTDEGRATRAVAEKIMRSPTPRLTHDEVVICAKAAARVRDEAIASGAGDQLDSAYVEFVHQFESLAANAG